MIDVFLGAYDPSVPREKLEFEAATMRECVLPDVVEIGHMNGERWRRIADTHVELGMAAESVDLSGFVYDPNPSIDYSWLYALLIGIAVALALAILFAIALYSFNRRLKHAVEKRSAKLRATEAKFTTAWDIATNAMVLSDGEGIVHYANPAYFRLYGYGPDEVIGRNFAIIFPEEERDNAIEQYRAVFALKSPPETFEAEIVGKNGESRLVESSIAFVGTDGRRDAMLSIIRDITEAKRAEESLIASVTEKTVLLRELHHRTNNNMQVVQGLLSLSPSRSGDPEVREMVAAIELKIHAMAVVHRRLYESGDYSRIRVDEYLRELCDFVVAQGSLTEAISIHYDLDPIEVVIDVAIPCGLVVNELLSNVTKHAFPDGSGGDIFVVLKETGDTVTLSIADNGVGLSEQFGASDGGTVDIEIVRAIVEHQPRGTFSIEENGGTECRLQFGRDVYRERIGAIGSRYPPTKHPGTIQRRPLGLPSESSSWEENLCQSASPKRHFESGIERLYHRGILKKQVSESRPTIQDLRATVF